MINQLTAAKLDFRSLGRMLSVLGASGRVLCDCSEIGDFLVGLKLAVNDAATNYLFATSILFSLGPTRSELESTRRAISLEPTYRDYALMQLLSSLREISDDESLGKTVQQLDKLSPELLQLVRTPSHGLGPRNFVEWDRMIWQSPDAVTFLSTIVQTPIDFAVLPSGPVVTVGFGWLEWETPPVHPAPAPWADLTSLQSSLETVRHPFWGAMVATLDACTGDYEWQSLILRGDLLRSFHRTLGNAQFALDSLWRSEFGLYPVDPLVMTPSLLGDHPLPAVFQTDDKGRSCLPWLKIALDHLHRSEIAIESEGSWRLTDRFRTQLMRDDEHMMAFEAIRQRSYRLARSATKLTLASTNEVAAS